MTDDTNSTSSATSNTRSDVFDYCRTSPFTRHVISSLPPSRSVTTWGPSGQNVSNPFARVNWTSFACRSRAVTSFAHV